MQQSYWFNRHSKHDESWNLVSMELQTIQHIVLLSNHYWFVQYLRRNIEWNLILHASFLTPSLCIYSFFSIFFIEWKKNITTVYSKLNLILEIWILYFQQTGLPSTIRDHCLFQLHSALLLTRNLIFAVSFLINGN